MTTKIHSLCDSKMRPLVVIIAPGQGGDAPMFPHLLDALRIPRMGRGRARTTPVAALGDKAYSSRAIRKMLGDRGIKAVIPEPDNQKGHRTRRGSKGGRPVGLDKEIYKRRNVIERSFNTFKQWRSIATRYDKLAIVYRGGVVLRAITIWLKQ